MNDTSRASFDPEVTKEATPPPVGPGNRLAKARAAANLTQEQVAAHLNHLTDIAQIDLRMRLAPAADSAGINPAYAQGVHPGRQ